MYSQIVELLTVLKLGLYLKHSLRERPERHIFFSDEHFFAILMMSFSQTVIIDDTIMTQCMLSWQWHHYWPRYDGSACFLVFARKSHRNSCLLCFRSLTLLGSKPRTYSCVQLLHSKEWFHMESMGKWVRSCSQAAWRATYWLVLRTHWYAFDENNGYCLYRTTVINLLLYWIADCQVRMIPALILRLLNTELVWFED